jgi:hypothetical protein
MSRKGKGVADIIFSIDASASMDPYIEGVKENISSFLDTIESSSQMSWDFRFDFIAHDIGFFGSVSETFRARSLFNPVLIPALYTSSQARGEFFTDNVSLFKQKLSEVKTGGDEANLIALDTALDFPWREKSGCHRIIIYITDEPVTGGQFAQESHSKIEELIEKIQALKVQLYLIAPECESAEELSSVDKSEWDVLEDDNFDGLSFHKTLEGIAKSISKSQTPLGARPSVKRGLFGQQSW